MLANLTFEVWDPDTFTQVEKKPSWGAGGVDTISEVCNSPECKHSGPGLYALHWIKDGWDNQRSHWICKECAKEWGEWIKMRDLL